MSDLASALRRLNEEARRRAHREGTEPPDPLTLNTRQAAFDELLTHYREAQETMWSGQGYDATDMAGVRLMPPVWTWVYRELERLLRRMRNQGHQQAVEGVSLKTLYWHVGEWYLRSESHPVYPAPRLVRYRQRGVLHEEARPAGSHSVRVTRHRDVRPVRVRLGLVWLDREWPANVGEPMVPDEILKAYLPGDEVLGKVLAVA